VFQQSNIADKLRSTRTRRSCTMARNPTFEMPI
jgi:hypothetical protein